jgi:hypothetical protein
MAAQNLPPTSIETQTNLTGAVTAIDESPDSPDANWLTASGSSTLRVGFATPTLAPVGTQTFRVYARCTNNGTYSQNLYPTGTPTFTNYTNNGGSSALDAVDDDQTAFSSSGGNGYIYGTVDDPSISSMTFTNWSGTGSPSGTQTIAIYCAKADAGTSTIDNGLGGEPDISISLSDTGGPITVTGGTQAVTGEGWKTWTFSAADLDAGDPDGDSLTLAVTTTNQGGGPNEASVAIDSIRWEAVGANAGASYDLDVYESGVKSGDSATGTITSTTGELDTGTWAHTVLGTADGSNVELYITQTAGVEYLEIGAVEWQSESRPTGHLYLGNSTDGVTEIYEAPIDTVNDNVFNYTSTVAQEYYSESPSIVPDTTEYARAGFGVGIGNVGNGNVTSLVHIVLDAPNAGYDIHAVATFPYHLRRISKRTNIKTLINL